MTWALGALCTAAMVRLAMQPPDDAVAIVRALAVVPARLIADAASPSLLVTLISSSFLHAGWVHLGGNLLYLSVFGPAVEDRLGHARFAVLYLFAGVAGAVAHVVANPASTAPLVGASGAIAGVLGAHLVLAPGTRVTTLVPALVIFEVASLPASFVIALWFLAQLASGLAPVAAAAGTESVAWFAHFGGFAAGVVLSLPAAVGGWISGRGRTRARHAPTRGRSGAGRGRSGRRRRKDAA